MFSMRHLVGPSKKPSHKNKQQQPKNTLVPYKKKSIPKALAEQVWIRYMGRAFEGKCRVAWCQNTLTVFDFQCGHNVPESRGGATTVDNLIPICSRCNLGMGNKKTIDEWSAEYSTGAPPVPTAPHPTVLQQPTEHRPQSWQNTPPRVQQNAFIRCLVSCFTYEERR